MTPETREELWQAVYDNWSDSCVETCDQTVDAIAPIIERLVAERVAALTAERDAAVAALQTQARCSRALGITEGERRATAAIVAFLQREADASVANYADHQCGRMFEAALLDAKCTIERGDHLTAHKPLDT